MTAPLVTWDPVYAEACYRYRLIAELRRISGLLEQSLAKDAKQKPKRKRRKP
jgi:hypothetical protein